jgi:uncharacterized protein
LGSNWSFLISRTIIFAAILFLLYLSQRFWFVRAWRLAGGVRRTGWRWMLRSAWMAVALLIVLAIVDGIPQAMHRIVVRGTWVTRLKELVGLWLLSAFLAFLAVQFVAGIEWLWRRARPLKASAVAPPAVEGAPGELPNPSRRYFFQTATYLAGAVPFVGAVYGFAAERLRFRIEKVEVPIAHLPAALDGLRIAQLSDIHIGGYMPGSQVRRAVEMANELGAELAVVTGDFITGATDPLEECIEELARLRASLGVWGCNGNHEIYADAEDYAAELFRRAGMRLLRSENAQLVWRGQSLNLIGVDYQRERTHSGRRQPKLMGVERLVRRDAPNILLSHNPNAFPRAAEFGIELTLAGHTHGGQVQVEILDRRWSPARFITNYVAGLYHRPLGAAPPRANSDFSVSPTSSKSLAPSFLYVNRGLGTIGAPVRIGVPPEITLLTLRRT